MVTGVLPLALEDATKTIQVFLLTGKEYVCLMTLHDSVPSTKLLSVMEEFVGEIYQKPPLRAAVKREVRKRRVYYIKDVEIDDRLVIFRVGCQAGTYIRKLVSDIGEVLGVIVAQATGLSSRLMNVQMVMFSFRLTPSAFVAGLCAALIIGALGGLLPAWRASRLGVIESIRAT